MGRRQAMAPASRRETAHPVSRHPRRPPVTGTPVIGRGRCVLCVSWAMAAPGAAHPRRRPGWAIPLRGDRRRHPGARRSPGAQQAHGRPGGRHRPHADDGAGEPARDGASVSRHPQAAAGDGNARHRRMAPALRPVAPSTSAHELGNPPSRRSLSSCQRHGSRGGSSNVRPLIAARYCDDNLPIIG